MTLNRYWLPKILGVGILGFTLPVFAAPPLTLAADPPVEALTTKDSTETTNKFDWKKVPPVAASPRPGAFVIPPSGPGYYSVLDLITGNERKAPPVSPYAPYALQTTPAFDIDFRYLENPNHEKDIFDPLKRIHIGDDFLLSFGGQFWYRNTRASDNALVRGKQNNFNLVRTRVHADLWFQDRVRLFAEFLDARTMGQSVTPGVNDQNHTELLNIFMDVKLANVANAPAYVRVGRQELTYGSQRLISSLDWANTRRTFQGVKTFWHQDKFNLDAFYVKPMAMEVDKLDQWDEKRNFMGVWGTYKPQKGHAADLYFLTLDNNKNPNKPLTTVAVDSIIHTIGSRYIGDHKRVLFELEGMYQFGKYQTQDISAYAVASGLGYHFADLPMNPQIWLRHDFASGGNNNGNTRGTFNQLFPFGNYYLGWIDRVGRQNIHDFNVQLALHPQPWATFTTQYHKFYLANRYDYLYNAAGVATARDATGRSGTNVGDEIDVRLNIHIDRHQDVLVGYSKLFAGDFLKATTPGVSPDLFYVQYNFRF